jgi:hypothetical protein
MARKALSNSNSPEIQMSYIENILTTIYSPNTVLTTKKSIMNIPAKQETVSKPEGSQRQYLKEKEHWIFTPIRGGPENSGSVRKALKEQELAKKGALLDQELASRKEALANQTEAWVTRFGPAIDPPIVEKTK